MNPDLLAMLISYMRGNAALVAAFSDSAINPSFWSNYNALQASITDPILPYLVFIEPNETKGYETKDGTGNESDATTGTLIAEIYSYTEFGARQLGEQVASLLNDCDEAASFPGLFYFRRLNQSMPPMPSTGPDSSPTIFRRQIAFKYIYEEPVP